MAGKAKKPRKNASRRPGKSSSVRRDGDDRNQEFVKLLSIIASGKRYSKEGVERIAGKNGKFKKLLDAFIERDAEFANKLRAEHRKNVELQKKFSGLAKSRSHGKETLYRKLFEQAHDAIFIENEDEKIVEVNSQACLLTGYTRDQLLGMKTRDLQTTEFQKGKTLKVYGRSATPESLETTLVNREGSEIPVHLTLAPLEFDGRRLVLSIVREISDIRQAERALSEREELYRTLVNTAQEAIIRADREENIQYANPAAAKLTGFDEDELVGMCLYDFLSPDDARILEEESKKRKQGETSRYEVGLRCKDGSIREIIVAAAPIFGSKDKVTSSMGVLTDITESKRALAALEREHQAFRIIAEASIQGADIPDLCKKVISGLVKSLEFDAGTFRILETGTKILKLEACYGLNEKELELAAQPQPVGDTRFIAALTAKTKKPIIAADVSKEKRLEPFKSRLGKFTERSLISWPVTDSRGKLLGILHLWSKSRKDVSAKDKNFFERIACMFANVLERRMTENALKESEDKHRTLIKSIRSPVLALSEDARILYCNDSFAKLVGQSVKKIQGRDFLKVSPEFTKTEFYKAYLKTLKTGKAVEVEAPFGERYFHAHIFRTPWGVLSITDDISERKSAQEELERYTRSMEGLYELVKEINQSADLVEMLEGISPLLADNPGVIAGGIYLIDGENLSLEVGFGPSKSFFTKAESIEKKEKGAAEVLQTRSAVMVPWFAGKDISKTKFKNRKGTLVGVSLCSAEDILGAFYIILSTTDDYTLAFIEMLGSEIGTGIKRKLVEDAMRHSEERFRSVYENIPIGMYRSTPDGRITMANPALLNMIGCKNFEELTRLNLEKGNFGLRYNRAAFKERIERDGEIVGWVTVLTKQDGSDITVRENAKVVRDQTGNTLYYEGTLEDITQLSVIDEISRAISSTLDINALYGIIHAQIKRLITANNFYIALYDEKKDEVSFPYAFQDGKLQEWDSRKAGKGMTEYVISAGKSQLFSGDKSEAYRKGTELIGKPSVSWLGVPMIIRDRVIGVMTVQSFEADTVYSEKDAGLMQTIANQAAQAVENARAYSDLEQRLTELSVFNQIAQALGSTLQLDELLQVIYNQTRRIMYAENFYVALYYDDEARIEFPFYMREGKKVKAEGRDFGQGLTEHVIKTQEPLLLGESYAEKGINDTIKRYTVGAEAQSWLGVPMISHDKVLGIIAVQSTKDPDLYDENHKRLLSSIANQAAGAVANAKAYSNLERRLTELSVFNRIARALSSTLQQDELMKLLHEQTKRLMEADTYFIASFDEEQAVIDFPYFIEEGKSLEVPSRPFGNGLTEYVIRKMKPLLIQHDEFAKECKKRGIDMIVHGEPPLSWLGVPMVSRDKVLGVICAQSINKANIYDENDKNILASIANQAAGMFANVKAYQTLEDQLTERSVINQISQAISSTLDIEELYGLIHDQLKRLINAKNFYIALYSRETDTVSFPYAFQDGQIQQWDSRSSGKGMTEYVISTGKPQLFQKDSEKEATKRGVEHIGKSSCSWLGVPMKIRNQVIGVMTVQSFDPSITYSSRDMELMQLVANQAAQAVENARSYADIEHRLTELSVFNAVGRALGSTLNLNELIDVIYTQTSRIMDTQSFYIALHNEDENTIEFPLFKASDGQRISLPPRRFGEGLTEYVITSRKSVLLSENVVAEAKELGVEIKVVANEAVPASWLGTPMIFHDKVVGVIGVQNTKEPSMYDENHQRMLEAISNQAAGAVVNARSYAKLERRLTELSVINEIGRALGATSDLEGLLEIIHSQVGRITDTDNLYIALYDEKAQTVEFPFSMDSGKRVEWPTRPLGNALTDHIIKTRQSLLIKREVMQKTKELGIDVVVIGKEPKCWLGAPMISADKVVGVIAVQSTQKTELFDEDHQRLLESIANQAAGVVANARAYATLERHGGELKTLLETATTVSSLLDEKEVSSHIAAKATELIGASGCTFYRYDEGANVLIAETTTVTNGRKEILAHHIKPGQGITGRAASERREILANHVHRDPEAHRIPGTKELPTCLMSVPLISRDKLLGVMTLARFTEEGFEDHDLELFSLFATQVADATANSRLFARLNELNVHLEHRRDEFGALFRTSTELSSTLDADEVAELIARKSTELIGADGCTVYRYDPAEEVLIPQVSTNRKNLKKVMNFRLKLGEGVTGKAAAERRPLRENHVHRTGSSAHVPGTKKEPTCLLSAPLISKGELLGVMTLTRLSSEEFSEHDLQLFTFFARQAAENFANSRLFGRLKELTENLERRSEELKTLFDTSTELASTLDEEEVAKIITERAKFLIPSSGCTFYRFSEEEGKLIPVATTVTEEEEQRMTHKISLGEGVSGKSAELRKPLLENKVHLDPKAPRIPDTDEVHTNIIAVPLTARGELLGDMTITRLYDEDFTHHDLQIATLFARQAEQAVANARLFGQLMEVNENLERRRQEMENLINVSTGVSSTLDEEEMATYIAERAKELIPSTGCTFYAFNKATAKLVPLTTTVMEEYEERMAYHVPLGEGVTGTAARDRKTIMANRIDLSPDAVCVPGTENLPTSLISSPLIARGELIGTLTLVRMSEEVYSDDDKQIFSLFTRQVAEAFANCRLFSQMRDFNEALEQKVTERTRELERAKFKLEDIHADYKERVKSRLETLAPILEKVGKGDFSERIPMPEKADEFTDLFRNLNLMIFDMQNLVDENLAKTEELQSLNEDLEAQVAERTLDLESAHEQLKTIHAEYRNRVNGYLEMLNPVLEKVGRWDFSDSLPVEEITDEFKDLFEGLNRMIENLRFMVDENRRRSEALKTLLETNTEVSSLLDEEKVTGVVTKRATDLFKADGCIVYSYDASTKKLVPRITNLEDFSEDILNRSIPYGEGVSGRVAAVREAICESKIKDKILEFPVDASGGKDVSMMAAPMVSQGELIGVMTLVRFGKEGFVAHRDLELFHLFALQVADAAANSRLYEKQLELNENLETMVAQRTDELEVANRKLKRVHDSYQERVRQRLSTIAPVMEKVSLGDFSENIPVHETEDEFTELFVGLNLMIDDLRFMFDENRRRSEELKNLNEDLKRRSEELREREQLYRTLVQTAQEAITLADSSESIIFANPALGDLLGYEPEELVGMTLLDFLPEDEREFILKQTDKRKRGETSRYELTLIPKDGVRKNVLVTAAPIYDADGNYTASMGILTDITDRKRSEQERQTLLETTTEVGATLDESEVSELIAHRATDLIKADRATIYRYDAENELLIPQTTTTKGADKKNVLSYRIPLGEGVTGKTAERRKSILANNVHKDTKAPGIPETAERPTCLLCAPLVSKGELLGVMSLTRLSEEGFVEHDRELLTLFAGQVADAMANSRLLSQLRELTQNLEEMVERRTAELAESNRKTKAFARELEEVIYVTSHDLKTPLRAISGFSQFLAEDYSDKLDSKAKLYLNRLVDSTKRMEQLLDDLLNISAISSREEKFKKTRMSEMIKEAVAMTSPGADTEIVYDEEKLPAVYCDRSKIVEVLYNLINNGIKFNDKPRKRVEISSRRSNGFYEFAVKDNGIGIEKRHFDRIFMIFQRLHRREEYDGTGVGLSMVKRVIEEHNGRIWVESQLGTGTIFHFTLPEHNDGNRKKPIGERSE